jgi:hypothetical protein
MRFLHFKSILKVFIDKCETSGLNKRKIDLKEREETFKKNRFNQKPILIICAQKKWEGTTRVAQNACMMIRVPPWKL